MSGDETCKTGKMSPVFVTVPLDWYEHVKETLEYHATEDECEACQELLEQESRIRAVESAKK